MAQISFTHIVEKRHYICTISHRVLLTRWRYLARISGSTQSNGEYRHKVIAGS